MQFRLCNMMEADCSAYLMRVDHGSPMTQVEQREAWFRHRDHLRTVLHDFGSRVDFEESQGSSHASTSFLCPATMHEQTSQPDQGCQWNTTAGNVDTKFK